MTRAALAGFVVAVTACAGKGQPAQSPPAEPPITIVDASGAGPAAQTTAATAAPAPPPPPPPLRLTSQPIPLPGAKPPLSLDYLAVDRKAGRVWIPAAGTGSVDVLDIASNKVTQVKGFATADKVVKGEHRTLGPSSATVGDGVAYVGDRANAQICVVDGQKFKRGACTTLASPPDGLLYVPSVKELWATLPHDNAIVVLDASLPAKLKVKTKIALAGKPEGYAVDDAHGTFYTNLEDKDKTVVLDVKTHAPLATYDAQCGAEGPRGVAVDGGRGFVFVACTDHVEALLDVARSGTILSKADVGAGIDNIDYLETKGFLYVAAGGAATLSVLRVDDKGGITLAGSGPTVQGGRTAVVASDGTAFVIDPVGGGVLVVSSAP